MSVCRCFDFLQFWHNALHFSEPIGTFARSAIAQRFQLDLVPNQTIELQPSITLRPRCDIQVILKNSRNPNDTQ
ncbi:hypothetical protein J5X98_08610 [Leptothermofonsia sichuanensis E412]|uniref:cytochrome P450 n=1 Tax=Leptothermofonsia sichuanensis TaxID=2917832 RepID=UPI001CA704E0|nr:cytochrome P450 [Leptothermofonsia sichuanensis]QZZ22423.1 hypothetical protein J5X98_08610 [Leptothermofonsia sichuanensis E412]